MGTGIQSCDWNPQAYLKFADQRTQPSIDLVSRIAIDNPHRIIDIGCGPGNSSQVLVQRWPHGEVTGLDNSPAMIEKAKRDYSGQRWILGEAADIDPDDKYDIVFSNAVIQWIPDHEKLVNMMFAAVSSGGALAVQVPQFSRMPMNAIIEDVSGRVKWAEYTAGCSELFTYHDHSFYYNLLSEKAERLDMWETSYIHVMDSHESLLEWIRSTALKPYLEKLPADNLKKEFEAEILEEIKKNYISEKNGKVLFPFIRLFFVAYKHN